MVLARALLSADRPTEALEVVSIGLEGQPEDGLLLMVAGEAWLRRGDLLRAQAVLLRAARSRGEDKDPLRLLGEVLLRRGDPERAVKVFERAQALDPADPAVRSLLERAQRLARIAGGTEAEPVGEGFGPAFEEEGPTKSLKSASQPVLAPDLGGATTPSLELPTYQDANAPTALSIELPTAPVEVPTAPAELPTAPSVELPAFDDLPTSAFAPAVTAAVEAEAPRGESLVGLRHRSLRAAGGALGNRSGGAAHRGRAPGLSDAGAPTG